MLATFIVEIGLAVYVLWRYKFNNITRLAVATLLFLATFQLAEYNVCEGAFGLDALTWSKIGYVAITMLPPLGLHLSYELAGAKKQPILPWAYLAAGIFVIFFGFVNNGITGQACLGNYVIFNQASGSEWAYGAYYYGLIAAAIYLAWKLARAQTHNIKLALYGLIMGYAVFLLPTATVNIINKQAMAGTPSVMCGFAVLYALILVIWIMPKSAQAKH
jgi:hypothetical protein